MVACHGTPWTSGAACVRSCLGLGSVVAYKQAGSDLWSGHQELQQGCLIVGCHDVTDLQTAAYQHTEAAPGRVRASYLDSKAYGSKPSGAEEGCRGIGQQLLVAEESRLE